LVSPREVPNEKSEKDKTKDKDEPLSATREEVVKEDVLKEDTATEETAKDN
jgi:hypothetical protein